MASGGSHRPTSSSLGEVIDLFPEKNRVAWAERMAKALSGIDPAWSNQALG